MAFVTEKSIKDLTGMKFNIPSYQRGYRWTSQQVLDLLNDIYKFATEGSTGFYCLQPLVVEKQEDPDMLQRIKEAKNLAEVEKIISENSWDVIDGQQRLTTLFIIMALLFDNNNMFSITYETRNEKDKSIDDFLKDIAAKDATEASTIDMHYMQSAKDTINQWVDDELKTEENKDLFKNTLLNKVKFIWYETDESDPIEVFTRLNVGKIALTNAELIKALILNKSNFDNDVATRQNEIAMEWDNIEYTLQNDEFWLFINDKNDQRSTRIDMLFELYVKRLYDKKELPPENNNNEYHTFRSLYDYFSKEDDRENAVKKCWDEVKDLFNIFQEWYNDMELYHYVGFIISQKRDIDNLLEQWNECNGKAAFIAYLKTEIKEIVKGCVNLEQQYEIESSNWPKTKCLSLLLLHNIQNIINQNRSFKEKDEYKLEVFYKFPFHLYKLEKWNVEHIDSNTTNSLNEDNDRKQWLKSAWCFLNDNNDKDNNLRNSILEWFNNAADKPDFDVLHDNIEDIFSTTKLTYDEKNQIWNFVLLDEHTNKSYGNSIFPVKRQIILGKDQGLEYEVIDKKDGGSISGFEIRQISLISDGDKNKKRYKTAFVPPITKMCFLKAFDGMSSNPLVWDKGSAEAYKENIKQTLKEFLK